MRPILPTAFLIFFAAVASFGQVDNIACPSIKVVAPEGLVWPGDSIVFVVEVGTNDPNFRYRWRVSRGVIEKGQGTTSITVRTSREDAGEIVSAEISIDGVLFGCNNKSAEAASVDTVPVCDYATDEFGELKKSDVRARVDAFFIVLQNNPEQIGLVLFGITDKERNDRSNPRLRLIVQHAKFRKFDLDRLIFKFEKSEVVNTKLYRMPTDSEMPCPECMMIYGRELK